jgi:hypothetical protein
LRWYLLLKRGLLLHNNHHELPLMGGKSKEKQAQKSSRAT